MFKAHKIKKHLTFRPQLERIIMIEIISFKICPFVQHVTATLELRNIPYNITYIDLGNKPQWFLDISPNGQVPLLITENKKVLFESDAIIEYIEDKYGKLEPQQSPEDRAIDRAWAYLGSKNYMTQCGTMRSKTQEKFTLSHKKLLNAFAKIEEKLSTNHTFFKSHEIGIVDIAWLPLLHRAHIVKEQSGFDFFINFPKIQKWKVSLFRTGLMRRSVSKGFEKEFINFYLKNTYLANNNTERNVHNKKPNCMTSTNCCG